MKTLKIRKQGKCLCEECKKTWEYDYQEEPDLETLDIGYTQGFTRYQHCYEHNEVKDV